MIRKHARRLVAASFCALAAWMAPAHAASVVPLYLDEVIDQSASAFEGTCTGNRTERDAATGLIVTYTTFAVRDPLKGGMGTTHEIKQIGGKLDGDGAQYRVDGVPGFAVGEDYVVFLAGASSAGFSSPIGLLQGRFTIKATGATRRVANGRDFRETTARMPAAAMPGNGKAQMQQAAAPVRDMDLDEFKQLVRAHLGAVR